jgi:N-acetylneuraminate lyase
MNLQGIFPAVLTPFGRDGGVDPDRFATHVDRLYKAGVHGIMIGGNAGEWYSLTVEERETLTSAGIELSRGRGKAIVHIGCLRVEDALRLATHAARAGADAISSLPPSIARCSAAETRNYFERIGSATDLPLYIYYFPTMTGGLSGEPFFSCVRGIPGLAGYKFTDTNLFDLNTLLEDGLQVFNGHDPNLTSALLMGASGGIGSFYNVLPRQSAAIYKACRAGDLQCAEQMQREVNRVIRTVRKYRLIPALKFIAAMQGNDLGEIKEPLLPLTADEQREIASELNWLFETEELSHALL